MLTKSAKDLLDLQAYEALRREIDEAAQFTVQQYQQHLQEEKQIADARMQQEESVSKQQKPKKEEIKNG